ncbi:alpha/beta fold hydrolase [Streptomyces sp. NPDC001388]|uniref:alpha/beta fold hydrolase n=1 Tax=unclassified Streptomyces TaxID=2593676 RepID=UPI0036A24094
MAALKMTDHWVPHKSSVPATKDKQVQLFVRERYDASVPPADRKPVLMLHGRSVPALAGFDLQHTSYGWAEALARAGHDVFMMDLQGSGRSPRPRMEDPCNISPAQQKLAMPWLTGTRTPSYPFQLTNSDSDADELSTVVEYIRKERQVEKVALIGWSAASFTMGPYAVRNPKKVESLFLLAPIFPPLDDMNPSAALPLPGFPMFVLSRSGLKNGWDSELDCADQREPDMLDVAWNALMEEDPVGRNWGAVDAATGRPEGVSRIRNFYRWGWNNTTAGQDRVLGGSVPVLIVHGESDRTANTTPPSTDPRLNFSVPALYKAIKGEHKLIVEVECAGHSMPWEIQHKNLHSLSKHWLKHLKVDGKTQGSFVMDRNGAISPAP